MIRFATTGDAAQICAIYNHYVSNSSATFEVDAVSEQAMAERISAAGAKYPWLVAERAAEIEGYAYAGAWKPRFAYRKTVEVTVYVAPRSLRHGIGASLYLRLFDELRKLGYHCALAGISLPNQASVALHELLGFHKVGELQEVGFKFGKWINVGYWELLL